MSEWYERLLEEQLSRNRDIWAGMREQGVADGSELRLGFRYVAADVAGADQLVAFLHEQTDYEVRSRVRPDDDDEEANADGEPEWIVVGTTQPTAVSAELLDDWCEWMIAAGATEGPCAFDGWAAQLAGDPPA
jgi:hypothetical protein